MPGPRKHLICNPGALEIQLDSLHTIVSLPLSLFLFFRIVSLDSSKTDPKCLLLGKVFYLEKPTQEPENRSLELAT